MARPSPLTRPLLVLALAALALGAASPRAGASDAAPAPVAPPGTAGRLDLSTERVVVFKDGYALFAKRATGVADAEGRAWTEEVPSAAALGCVWAVAADRRTVGLRAGWEERRETRTRTTPCLSVLDLLRANVGGGVTLGLSREGALDVTGTLHSVLEDAPPPDPSPASPPSGPAGTTVREAPLLGGQLVVVTLSGGAQVTLPVAEVRTVGGASLKTTIARREEVVVRAKRLWLDLGREAAGKPVDARLYWFGAGVRWIPTYRVGGRLESDAEIALQAEVVNDAEDLRGAALDLVVGVPSFRFKEVRSPLVLEQALVTVMQQREQMAQQMFDNRLSNIASNAFSNDEASVALAEGTGAMESAPELAAEAAQDLFVYGVGTVTLPKGGRAAYPLWQTTASARHLYTMDVRVLRNYQSGEHAYQSAKSAVRRDREVFARESSTAVWHELELANATKQPWTTGAALLVKDGVPLGQDLVRYTPAGGKTLLPVTVAVDLRGAWREQETARQSDVLVWSGTRYSLVEKKGLLSVASYRKEPSTVRVTLAVGGKVTSASMGGQVVVNDLKADDWVGGAYAVNNHSDVTWEFTLAPGETKMLEVAFSFFVR